MSQKTLSQKTFRWSSLLLVAGAVYGQNFEVATVKPFAPNANGGFPLRTEGGPGTSDPGRIRYVNLTFKRLLMAAYGVGNDMISGPAWLDTERCVIEATIPAGATKDQVNQMLQNLLAERFKLAAHRETKDVALYELTLVKQGPKLKKPDLDDDGPPPPGPFEFAPPGALHAIGKGQTMAGLVEYLSLRADRPVVDKTGLSGKWDYELEFAPGSAQANAAADAAPDLVTAVREELGLKMQSKKGPIEMVIVDHIEKAPVEN